MIVHCCWCICSEMKKRFPGVVLACSLRAPVDIWAQVRVICYSVLVYWLELEVVLLVSLIQQVWAHDSSVFPLQESLQVKNHSAEASGGKSISWHFSWCSCVFHRLHQCCGIHSGTQDLCREILY